MRKWRQAIDLKRVSGCPQCRSTVARPQIIPGGKSANLASVRAVSTTSAIASILGLPTDREVARLRGRNPNFPGLASSADADVTAENVGGHLTVANQVAHRPVNLLIVEQSSRGTIATPWLTVPIDPTPSQTVRFPRRPGLTKHDDRGLHQQPEGSARTPERTGRTGKICVLARFVDRISRV